MFCNIREGREPVRQSPSQRHGVPHHPWQRRKRTLLGYNPGEHKHTISTGMRNSHTKMLKRLCILCLAFWGVDHYHLPAFSEAEVDRPPDAEADDAKAEETCSVRGSLGRQGRSFHHCHRDHDTPPICIKYVICVICNIICILYNILVCNM